jgi:hypothetical protein
MVGAVESLVYLSLANCSGFTDAGLANLNNLRQLKHLVRPTTLPHARLRLVVDTPFQHRIWKAANPSPMTAYSPCEILTWSTST